MSSIRLTDSSTLTDDATARQLAVDPSTPPAELERLLGRGAEIDRALVRHPNVPLRVYRTLAPAYPRSACANPAIGRLIEEEPGLIQAMPRLLEQPLCPPSIVAPAKSTFQKPAGANSGVNPEFKVAA